MSLLFRHRSILFSCCLIFTACLAASSRSFAQEQRPNILLIVSDDTGFGDLGP